MIEFINPYNRGEYTEYDCVVTLPDFTSRISVKVYPDTDIDSLGEEIEASEILQHEYRMNRESILATMEQLRASFKGKVASGSISIDQILATNHLINQNLGVLGINLETPNLQNLLLERIDATVDQLKDFYNRIEVNNTVKTASLLLLSKLNGNS